MTSIFISYSSKDVKIAESIQEYLEHDGFDVWRDKSEIRRDWSKEIAAALSRRDVILVIWSEDSSKSEWVKNEWITARALGKPTNLVVITALEKLPIPLRNLDAIVVKNNDNINPDIMQQIIKKIKDTTTKIEYDYKILPPNRDIPYDPNPDFTGRSTELLDLYLEVLGDLSKLNYSKVGLVGIGGVGKTQLAVEFAYRFGFAFEEGGIYWIDGTNPATWISRFAYIARLLDLKISNPDMNSADRDKQYFIEFEKYCRKYGSKMLLVMDNIIDPLDLYKDDILFPGDPIAKSTVLTLGCNLLFTTRRDFKDRLPNTIEHNLEMLLPAAAFNLLTRYRKPDSKKEEEFATMICNSTGNLPLAIVLIGGYLRKYSDMSIKEYYDEHIKDRLSSIDLDEISADELATRHEAAIRVTFEPEWKILKDRKKPLEIERNQNAEKLVSILSLLPESAIVPKNRLIVYSGIEKYGKTKLIRPAESAFIFLKQINLLYVLEKGKSVRIHPLLREYVLEKLQEESTKNQPINLRVESILNLKRAYYDNFPSLVQEYVERNGDIDSIREDFEIAPLWSKELPAAIDSGSAKISKLDLDSVYLIEKVIDQERNNLRPTANEFFMVNNDKSIVFAQCMHIRSIDLNYTEIADKSRQFLLQSKKSFLDIRWSKVRNKEPLLRTLEGHSSFLNSVAISSDNSKIVSGSSDRTIKLWDLDTGKLLNTLEGHTNHVNSVATTSDNSKIVSGSSDRTIKLWDLDSGKLLNTLEGHRGPIHSVAITSDNSKIVSGSDDKTIKVWDLDSGKLIHTLEGHSAAVNSVAITSDNSKIVSGSDDKTIKLWDLDSGKLIHTLECRSGTVSCIAITSDNSKIVSGSYDATIKVWELSTGQLLNTIKGHSRAVSSVAITSDNTTIVSGGSYDEGDNTIKVWRLNSRKLINTLEGHSGYVRTVGISSDNIKIVSGSNDKTIKVWDLNSGELLYTIPDTYSINSVAITSDNSKIVSGSSDNTIKVWDLNTGKLLYTLEGHSDIVRTVAITSDNSKIVSGSWDETIKVWDLNTGKLLYTLDGHTDVVYSVVISSDNSKIVSGSEDRSIKVWDLNSGKLLRNLKRHSGSVNSVAITSNNGKIVSGSNDKTINVWDLNTGKLLITLVGHSGSVKSVAITSDNTKIVSGSNDKTINVWDINTGKSCLRSRFDVIVTSVALSKNGNWIALGGDLGDLYMGALFIKNRGTQN
jgi:WD40 repeat protein